jgi:hypothetical protein
MSRRNILRAGAAFFPYTVTSSFAGAGPQSSEPRKLASTRADWPSDERWDDLAKEVGGRLKPVEWPIADCIQRPRSAECEAFFQRTGNPGSPSPSRARRGCRLIRVYRVMNPICHERAKKQHASRLR